MSCILVMVSSRSRKTTFKLIVFSYLTRDSWHDVENERPANKALLDARAVVDLLCLIIRDSLVCQPLDPRHVVWVCPIQRH